MAKDPNRLDETRPHGTVIGQSWYVYEQDGKFFNGQKRRINRDGTLYEGTAIETVTVPPSTTETKPAEKPKPTFTTTTVGVPRAPEPAAQPATPKKGVGKGRGPRGLNIDVTKPYEDYPDAKPMQLRRRFLHLTKQKLPQGTDKEAIRQRILEYKREVGLA